MAGNRQEAKVKNQVLRELLGGNKHRRKKAGSIPVLGQLGQLVVSQLAQLAQLGQLVQLVDLI